MKISLIASVTLTMIAETVVARNCNADLNYCGYNNKIGDYQSEMEAACNAAGTPCPGKKADNVLFYCVPGFINSIKEVHDCVQNLPDVDYCKDGGAGKSDSCDFVRPSAT